MLTSVKGMHCAKLCFKKKWALVFVNKDIFLSLLKGLNIENISQDYTHRHYHSLLHTYMQIYIHTYYVYSI